MCGSNSGQSQSESHSMTADLSSDFVTHDIGEPDLLVEDILMPGNENETWHADPLSNNDIRHSSARFLLQLREGKGLSQVAVDTVVEGCEKVVNECLHHVHMDIKSSIQDPEKLEMIDSAFQNRVLPFNGLQTKYQQEKFYVQEFNMIVSMGK